MQVDLTLEQMLETIESPELVYGRIVGFGPFESIAQKRGLDMEQAEEYTDSFEDTARDILMILTELFGYSESLTYQNLFMEYYYNAFCHGSKFNPNLPVTVYAYSGNSGAVISISDDGEGFDVKTVIDKHEFENGGIGFNILSQLKEKVYWNYENNGSTWHFMFLKETEMRKFYKS